MRFNCHEVILLQSVPFCIMMKCHHTVQPPSSSVFVVVMTVFLNYFLTMRHHQIPAICIKVGAHRKISDKTQIQLNYTDKKISQKPL